MKKIIAILLLLSMLLGILVSCKDDKSSDAGPQDSESEEEVINDGLPNVDMNGFELKIRTQNPTWFEWAEIAIAPDENTSMGNTIYQEMFERNAYIEQRFNCFITVDTEQNLNSSAITNMVLGDDPNSAHLLMYYDKWVMDSALYFLDWNNCPYVNLEADYWNPGITSLFNIQGKQFAASGSFSLGMLSRTGVMIFNKKMYEQHIDPDVSTMYQYVENNEWTLDKLYEIAAGAMVENGDEVWDEKDQYGICASKKEFYTHLMVGCGIKFIDENDKGKLALVANKSIDKLEKILTLNQDNDIYFDNSNDINYAGPKNFFADNGTLFAVTTLFEIPNIRASMENEFGILPMPKYTSDQKQFYGACFGGDMACILKTVTEEELENVGLLMEALAFHSHQKLIPLYKDVLIRTRYASDVDSRAMLDIIFASTTTDFGINALEQIVTYELINQVYKPETNVISSSLLGISINVNIQIDTLLTAIK